MPRDQPSLALAALLCCSLGLIDHPSEMGELSASIDGAPCQLLPDTWPKFVMPLNPFGVAHACPNWMVPEAAGDRA